MTARPRAAPLQDADPEIGGTIVADGIRTNVHDLGSGHPVLMIHGSGPGVTAWANWRLNLPALAEGFRVVAPDCVGFGYTERPDGICYTRDVWLRHLLGVLDTLGIERADIVGNSFGGSMALALAAFHPERVRRLVLMGSVGVEFELTAGLDAVWGYKPGLDEMRRVMRTFAYNQDLVRDDLAALRYRAASRPGISEAFAAMFPAPRQRWVSALALDEDVIRGIDKPALLIHGREDQVIPLSNSSRLLHLLPIAELHVFGRCGHWTQIEHKDRFNALVTNFLS